MCQFSGKTDKFDFFDPNLPKNGFWGQNFEKLSPDTEQVKRTNFTFSAQICPKKDFGVRISKF